MAEDEQADWIRIVRCAHADGQRFRCLGTQRDRTSSGERFRPLPVSEPTRSEQRAWHGEFGQVKCSYGGLVGFTACRLLEFVFVWRTTSFHAVKATMMLKQTVVRARLGVLRKLWQIYAETVLPLEQKPAPDCEKPPDFTRVSVAWRDARSFYEHFCAPPISLEEFEARPQARSRKESTFPFSPCCRSFLEVLLLGQYSTGKTSMAPALSLVQAARMP